MQQSDRLSVFIFKSLPHLLCLLVKQKWTRESVLVLIACYETNKDKFKSALHKKKHIWQDIAKVINDETGQFFTWFQVQMAPYHIQMNIRVALILSDWS